MFLHSHSQTNLLELLVVLCLCGVVHAAGVPLGVPRAPQVHEVRPENDHQRSQDDADAADDEDLEHEELLLVLLLLGRQRESRFGFCDMACSISLK